MQLDWDDGYRKVWRNIPGPHRNIPASEAIAQILRRFKQYVGSELQGR